MTKTPFWKSKPLSELTPDEWESICCRCGRCCLIKLQDDETEDIYYTRIICRFFDCQKHLCREYTNRCTLVPECLKITPQNISSLNWMPKSCAYRILNETGDLPNWHPLRENGSSPPLPDNLTTDILVDEENLENYIIEDEEI